MSTECSGCARNTDPLRLVREGTDKDNRLIAALAPSHVPVDEHRPEHSMVFASAYAEYLRYFDLDDTVDGHWQDFFASDVSAQLAVVAIEDVRAYRSTVKELLRSIVNPEFATSGSEMVAALGHVFDCLATLATRIDELKVGIPADLPLRSTLQNLIQAQLSPMLRRLIGYHAAGQTLGVVDLTAPPPNGTILGRPIESFAAVIAAPGLSGDWAAGSDVLDWAAYVTVDVTGFEGAFGPGTTDVDRVNYLAGNELFTAACDAFLGVFARVVDEAKAAIDATFAWDGHEPHYALFLAFLRLFEHARAELNTLSARHLDFYYRRVLQLEERPAQPSRAHVLVELAKHAVSHELTDGTLLKAGKDHTGADILFSVDRPLTANRAAVADLRRTYRHHNSKTESLTEDEDRIFASVIDPSQEFHPFAEKTYADGELTSIAMAPAEVGIAIASHHLWLAEGTRRIGVSFHGSPNGSLLGPTPPAMRFRLTAAKGWVDAELDTYSPSPSVTFDLRLDGNIPPVTPYNPEVHGYGFDTSMPVLLILLENSPGTAWDYARLENFRVSSIELRVHVEGLRTLALSNELGQLDSSKPFLPFGPTPSTNSSFVIGSKEAFQKAPSMVVLHAEDRVDTNPAEPTLAVDYLDEGTWKSFAPASGVSVNSDDIEIDGLPMSQVDAPDLTSDVPYATTSRAGFVRLRLSSGFGTDTYPTELAKWIASGSEGDPPALPVIPKYGGFSLEYRAMTTLDLSTSPGATGGRMFHVGPFGHAEPVVSATSNHVPLLPQFRVGSEHADGELYIGVSGLVPPQNLTLLFQVVDGTANPRLLKPERHLDWTYLRGDEWESFPTAAVSDGTDELLASGIVTLAVPADANLTHRVVPAGLHWIRVAVAADIDAVCRLTAIAAQAASATCVMGLNAVAQQFQELPAGTITKLAVPDAAVKAVTQPFPTFGGRRVETSGEFAVRASERLRHKDRAIALWDYEHLVLEAFPDIYQARCLNHTQYEPTDSGTGVYRELAPGHVTIVTVPDMSVPSVRDPLRPYTSLRVRKQIEEFLTSRVGCFTRLHVTDPQFEEVRVDLRVRLHDGVDEAFHQNLLRREITGFLSPWAFSGDSHPTFNRKVYKSVLVDFIEERPYVDYVTHVRVFRRLPGETADGPDLDEVVGSLAVSILVSVPPDDHTVTVIHSDQVFGEEKCTCAAPVLTSEAP